MLQYLGLESHGIYYALWSTLKWLRESERVKMTKKYDKMLTIDTSRLELGYSLFHSFKFFTDLNFFTTKKEDYLIISLVKIKEEYLIISFLKMFQKHISIFLGSLIYYYWWFRILYYFGVCENHKLWRFMDTGTIIGKYR